MNDAVFFEQVRTTLFGGSLSQPQVDGLNALLTAWGSGDKQQLAYVLAGAFHETGRQMVPVREGFASTDAEARRIVAGRSYGHPAGPYAQVYYGRGRIQNTWLPNYQKLTTRFGIDFVQFPDKLLDPATDATVTVVGHVEGIWTGRKLSDFIANGKADYVGARAIVNGSDRAVLIAGYAAQFEIALTKARYGAASPIAAPAPPIPAPPLRNPTPPPPPVPAKPIANGAWAELGRLFLEIISAVTAYLQRKPK
jgi:hypothetical protein